MAKVKVIDEWKVRDAAETLKRAGEIFNDEDLLAAAEAELQKSKKAIKSVSDLKAAYERLNDGSEEESEDESEDAEEDEPEEMPKKVGLKKELDTRAEQDDLPPDSMFESYDQAKKHNKMKMADIKKKAEELED